MSFMKSYEHQQGFALLEVLIAIVIVAVGLLGLAGLQAKMIGVEMESYQRSHALILLEDMMNRIRSDEAAALAGAYDVEASENANVVAWKKNIAGYSGVNQVGAMIGAQGCLDSLNESPKTIRVTIAWQGLTETAAPPAEITCGSGSYGSEMLRRAVFGTVIVLPSEN